jgi:hypothetical protein
MNNVYENKFSRKTFENVLRGVSNNAELLHIPSHVDRTWLRGDIVPATTIKKLNREYAKEGLPLIESRSFFKSIDVLPLHKKDWLGRLTTNRLKQTIQDAAAQGMESDIKAQDPTSAYLYGLEFGQANDPKKKSFY